MTVKGIMVNICRSILADNGKDKTELTNQDARNIQEHIGRELGVIVDDRDIKIFYNSFAEQYWKTHQRPPSKRKDLPRLVHAG